MTPNHGGHQVLPSDPPVTLLGMSAELHDERLIGKIMLPIEWVTSGPTPLAFVWLDLDGGDGIPQEVIFEGAAARYLAHLTEGATVCCFVRFEESVARGIDIRTLEAAHAA